MVWLCTVLSVYILNGVMDIKEDRINRSQRPVASGDLPAMRAAAVAAGLALIGVVGAFSFSFYLGLSVTVALLLGWLYSGPPVYLKRWPAGLATVATLGGLLTYQAGYLSNGNGSNVLCILVFSSVMSLWMGFVGQTKDLSDIEGDERTGRRSGPIAWGESAARVFYSKSALFLGGAFMFWAIFFAEALILPAFVLMLGALTVVVLLLGPCSRDDPPTCRKRPYQAFMFTQYGAHLAVVVG